MNGIKTDSKWTVCALGSALARTSLTARDGTGMLAVRFRLLFHEE
jgi:hypothetical protein